MNSAKDRNSKWGLTTYLSPSVSGPEIINKALSVKIYHLKIYWQQQCKLLLVLLSEQLKKKNDFGESSLARGLLNALAGKTLH